MRIVLDFASISDRADRRNTGRRTDEKCHPEPRRGPPGVSPGADSHQRGTGDQLFPVRRRLTG